MYRTGSVSSNRHLRLRGIPVTAITGVAFMASQQETAVIAVISSFPNEPVMWITFHGTPRTSHRGECRSYAPSVVMPRMFGTQLYDGGVTLADQAELCIDNIWEH